jgi:folylpolyglutamate synthase
VLGNTLKEIAWHKAGIFKRNVPAFSVIQDNDVYKVFCDRSVEANVKNQRPQLI